MQQHTQKYKQMLRFCSVEVFKNRQKVTDGLKWNEEIKLQLKCQTIEKESNQFEKKGMCKTVDFST